MFPRTVSKGQMDREFEWANDLNANDKMAKYHLFQKRFINNIFKETSNWQIIYTVISFNYRNNGNLAMKKVYF